jgi:thiol-disulfide isomerase/thioredoxin
MDFNSLYLFNLFKMFLVSNFLIVQSESREQILKTSLKTILILIISIVIISLFLFRNFLFKSTYLLKSFGELSVDPEIAFTNNKPTFLEFYAEWCEVCKEMAPKVSAFKDEYEKDINFVFLNVDNKKWGNYIQKFAVNGIPQVNLFDEKGNLISTFIGKQDEIKIRKSINNLKKEEKPYEEIINSEFSIIQENKNNEVNPRSHG